MKKFRLVQYINLLLILLLFAGCDITNSKVSSEVDEQFIFIFMTDIHLQPEKNAVEGFNQAIDTVNKLNPDFVITGGDLVMDVLGQDFERSEMLYNLYNKSLLRFNMPVYNTMGNHEIFGIYKESGIEKDHPEYGEKMYENRIGERLLLRSSRLAFYNPRWDRGYRQK